MEVVDAHTSIQVTPESPGTPRAMVYGLYRAHLGDRAFCHSHPQNAFASWEFDTSVGVSGPHDFARPPQARSSVAPSASTAARPANVTIAYRPFWWDGMAKDIVLGFSSVKLLFPKFGIFPEERDRALGVICSKAD